MKLTIEVTFDAPTCSATREQEIKRAIHEFGENLEFFGGKVIRADLLKQRDIPPREAR